MRLVFETKQTKTADDVRSWIQRNLGVNCSVAVHPSNTVIMFSEPISDSNLKKLCKWISENIDGKLLSGVNTDMDDEGQEEVSR